MVYPGKNRPPVLIKKTRERGENGMKHKMWTQSEGSPLNMQNKRETGEKCYDKNMMSREVCEVQR